MNDTIKRDVDVNDELSGVSGIDGTGNGLEQHGWVLDERKYFNIL